MNFQQQNKFHNIFMILTNFEKYEVKTLIKNIVPICIFNILKQQIVTTYEELSINF